VICFGLRWPSGSPGALRTGGFSAVQDMMKKMTQGGAGGLGEMLGDLGGMPSAGAKKRGGKR
jgi:hypothetical protein